MDGRLGVDFKSSAHTLFGDDSLVGKFLVVRKGSADRALACGVIRRRDLASEWNLTLIIIIVLVVVIVVLLCLIVGLCCYCCKK